MNDSRQAAPETTASWDTYWQGAQYSHAFSDSGVSHPAIQSFWIEFFEKVAVSDNTLEMVDIASGNGALVELAFQTMGETAANITCIDVSDAAITNIQQRFPKVQGHVCDARKIPLQSHEFNLVTSQFGVEYAGLEAIDEAIRLLAPGGRLALLLHYKTGSIEGECTTNLEVVRLIQGSEFIPKALEMFQTGFEAVRGADRKPYDDAALALASSLTVLEKIMQKHGKQVASGMVVRLYNDVAKIHARLQHYEPAEVLGWLKVLEGELDGYAERMRSMIKSSIDKATFDKICSTMNGNGLILKQAHPLRVTDNDLPMAWVIVAQKSIS